jgi:hypothetical protein
MSIEVPARVDTCPYAVTNPRRDRTCAASTTSLRCVDIELTLLPGLLKAARRA